MSVFVVVAVVGDLVLSRFVVVLPVLLLLFLLLIFRATKHNAWARKCCCFPHNALCCYGKLDKKSIVNEKSGRQQIMLNFFCWRFFVDQFVNVKNLHFVGGTIFFLFSNRRNTMFY